MKLFLFDEKHEQVHAEMEITNLKQTEDIILFFHNNHIIDRYTSLVIAEAYTVVYEDGERSVVFE